MEDGCLTAEGKRYMKSERNRLETFRHWPSYASQDPRVLARAGFYYRGVDDKVECPFCYGIVVKWQPNDDPFLEHRSHFPHCKFISGGHVGNVPLDDKKESVTPCYLDRNRDKSVATTRRNNSTRDGCAQKKVSNPLDFTKETNRLLTFSRWPRHLLQTPESLARAGFYHFPCAEKPDRVKCGYCRGKLFNWQTEDEPWTEHARCFPTCPYVKLCVGDDVSEYLRKDRSQYQ